MKYFIYKITNLQNGKYLIGRKCSITSSFKIKYSSNKYLKKDLKRIGSKGFKKEIIEYFLSKDEMNSYYKNLKSRIINDPLSYIKPYELSSDEKEKIIRGLKSQSEKKFPKFKGNLESESRYYFRISNYCSHGDFKIRKTLFRELYNSEDPIYCTECRKHPLEENPRKYLKNINSPKRHEEEWIKVFYPSLYYDILKIPIGDFQEKIYSYKNNLYCRPKCLLCDDEVSFCKSKKKYNLYCSKHIKDLHISKGEIEVFEFIEGQIQDKKILRNHSFEGNEIDIYIPDLSIGFEFNGLYWHSEIYRNEKYHFNKKKYFKKKGIDIFYIWEDDWNLKRDIIKSLIKNKLGTIENIINSGNCQIGEINSSQAKEFLFKNHVNEKIEGSINLGLFYNTELISIMVFSKKDQYELLKYVNKIDHLVLGGSDKLFSYFIEKNKPNKIISHSNNDFFDDEMYSILGFKNVGQINPTFWITDNLRRYNQECFLKTENEINKKSKYCKIWNSGTTKWILNI